MEGYISLHRQIEDNWIWLSEPFSKGQAWVDLLLLASHSESIFYIRGNKIELKCGEIGWSKEKLASRWKWSRKKVLNFLETLEKEQQITQQKLSSIVVLKINNYEKYQKKNNKVNNRRTTEEQQKNIYNNDNNYNNSLISLNIEKNEIEFFAAPREKSFLERVTEQFEIEQIRKVNN
jgi:phage-related minor tail protein